MDGINVVAIALMIVVSAQLARTAVVDGFTLGIAAVSALLLFCYRVNSTWLVVGAAVAGELVIWLGLPEFGRRRASTVKGPEVLAGRHRFLLTHRWPIGIERMGAVGQP